MHDNLRQSAAQQIFLHTAQPFMLTRTKAPGVIIQDATPHPTTWRQAVPQRMDKLPKLRARRRGAQELVATGVRTWA